MQLTKHFSLAELTQSSTATRLGLCNEATPEVVDALTRTAEMLENVREHLCAQAGKPIPIVVTSGYRGPAVNKAVGGVTSSDHCKGMAADILAPAFGSPKEIALALAPHLDALGIGQMIVEQTSPTRVWLHLSTAVPVKAANRVLSYNGKAYELGIKDYA